jgi:hypothetical protein
LSAGTVSQAGASVPVKVVDGVTYIQLAPAFLKQEAASDPTLTTDVLNLMQNKWVSSQSLIGQSLSSSFGGLTSYDTFMASIESGGASTSASAAAS